MSSVISFMVLIEEAIVDKLMNNYQNSILIYVSSSSEFFVGLNVSTIYLLTGFFFGDYQLDFLKAVSTLIGKIK